MIITLLFGAAFSASAQVLNILAWVGVLVFYSLLSSAGNLSIGVVKHGYWCCALAAMVNVSLNFLWIPKYSYIGSTWATLISEIILVGISFYYLIKNMGNVFNFIKWAKIIVANLVLYLLLGSDFYKINLFLKIGGSLTIYLFLIGMLGLIPKEDIYSVLTVKFQRFLSNSNSR